MEAIQNKIILGRVLSTPGINRAIARDPEYSRFVYESLRRHRRGDWGDVGEACKEMNDEFAENSNGGRQITSCYKNPGGDIYIVTDQRNESTTIIFINEY
jgi:hypothetical protein